MAGYLIYLTYMHGQTPSLYFRIQYSYITEKQLSFLFGKNIAIDISRHRSGKREQDGYIFPSFMSESKSNDWSKKITAMNGSQIQSLQSCMLGNN